MTTEQRMKVIEDFLAWLEDCTHYEIGEDVQSDYGDGESSFYSVDRLGLLNEYAQGLTE